MTEHGSSRYTRREFGSLFLKAGAGAALAASLPETRTARSDGEAEPEVPEAGFCENPTVKNTPEISIRNQRLYGVKVCFRDQPEGAKEAEQNAGFYDEGLVRIFNEMINDGIWKRYMRINTTYEILPGIYWSKYDFAETRARGAFSPLVIENLPDIWYDGNIYPIFLYMHFNDSVRVIPRPLSPPLDFFIPGPVAANYEYGPGLNQRRAAIRLPWEAANPKFAGLYDITTLEHERGHAIGRKGHNPNRRSVMTAYPLRHGAILDVNDVQGMCTYKVYLPIGHGPQIP